MNDSLHILIVDDDERIIRVLERLLGGEGYKTSSAKDAEELRVQLKAIQPDLIILDLSLPQENGFSITQNLRKKSDVPIIMLTGKADVVDKVVGLELGADDYITKPFNERELLARIKTVIRRAAIKEEEKENPDQGPDKEGSKYTFSNLTFNTHTFELISDDGAPIPLTPYEFKLLRALIESSPRPLSRDQLLDHISGRESEPFDRGVDVLIGKLRKKIEDNPKAPTIIKTVRGFGYKFAESVHTH